MKKLFRKLLPLGIAICLSATFSITSFADYDSKSGLEDKDYPSRYVNSDGQVILTSEGWEGTQPFFAGYAIVRTSKQAVQEGESWIFNYAIIDESGTTISTFNFQGSYHFINVKFRRFVENSDGYIYWISSSNSDGLYYVVGKLDGTQEFHIIPELCASFSEKVDTIYTIGTFRNGSANVYKVRTEKNNMFDYRESHKAVGSITTNGEFSTKINQKSQYKTEIIPKYGTKQFAENSVTKGWKENETGLWYDNGDGTYPVNQWKEIDGKQYYFGEDGYMYRECYTPDGYWVDINGVWQEDIPSLLEDTTTVLGTAEHAYNYLAGTFKTIEEFEQSVRDSYNDPVVAEQVIQEIEANYTFVPAQ